jgi:hypothetical protein
MFFGEKLNVLVKLAEGPEISIESETGDKLASTACQMSSELLARIVLA